jgi:rhodanese domain protein
LEKRMELEMKIKKIALMAIVGLISVLGISCGRTMNSKQVSVDSKEVKNEKKAEYKKITSDEAKNIMSTQKAIVVDVRSLEEYNEGHIPNAISVPLETIENEAEIKLKNKDDLILVYCRSGRRSREAALRLIEKGYTNVIDFGGIQDWNGEVVK